MSWLEQRFTIEVHWKNLISLSLSLTIILCSTTTAQVAQSTLNKDSGLGLASLSCVYVCCAISCLFANSFVRFFGTKWTLVICQIGYCSYLAANLYPTFFTLIPISMIYGSCAGPLYTAHGTYLTSIAISYASKSSRGREHTISHFTGVYYMIYLVGISPGSLMLSFLLQNKQDIDTKEHMSNYSAFCGAKDNCGSDLTTTYDNTSKHDNYEMPSSETRTKLFTALLVLGMSSILISIVFIDKLQTFSTHIPAKTGRNSLFTVAFSYKFLTLLPMIILFSYETVLFVGDFTKSFAGCTSGVATIGFLTAIYYFSGGVSAVVVGYFVQFIGRLVVLTLAWIIQMSLWTYMLLWKPENARKWDVYLMSSVYGIGSGLREAQVLSLLGILFPDDLEAANSALRFYWGAVIGITFAIGTAGICVAYKIWFALSWYTITIVLYFLLEWKLKRGYFRSTADTYQHSELGGVPEKECLSSGDQGGFLGIIEKETSL